MLRMISATLGALLLAASPALGHRSGRPSGDKAGHANSFSGSCQFAVSVVFAPPLTDALQTTTDVARGSGTCTGTFIGRGGRAARLNGAPVGYRAADQGANGSCAAADASGGGTLVFPAGRVRFWLHESRVGGAAVLSLRGRRGGSAVGLVAISQSESPVTLAQECVGSGIAQADVDIELHTTATMSG